jgi:hypothetical protein
MSFVVPDDGVLSVPELAEALMSAIAGLGIPAWLSAVIAQAAAEIGRGRA